MDASINTTFLSRRPNLDPEPNIDNATGRRVRSGHVTIPGCTYEPRPEFEPTRDPHPWVIALGPWRGSRTAERVPESEWAPRRDEYDAPVNPILARFRQDIRERGEHPFWGDTWDAYMDWLDHARATDRACQDRGITDDHLNHARKVLQRLADLTTKEN